MDSLDEKLLNSVVEDSISLAKLLEESSSFPAKLEEMFLLQKKLNDETNGANWELGINRFNKEINWLRCIYMEVCELIDSTPWKHWKDIKGKVDLNNIHIELVDIWHFLMSYILQETNIPKAVSIVNTHCIYEALNKDEVEYKDIIIEAEKLAYISLAIGTKNMLEFSGIERLVEQFFKTCKVSGLSFKWLQKIYIGKNALNKFRQDNGYKEGTYKKIWDDKEDNVVLLEMLKKNDDINFEFIYNELENIYKKVI